MDDYCGVAWFAQASGGTVVNGLDGAFGRVETDSRSAGPHALFVALKGERTDGHDYAAQAAASKAAAILVSQSFWDYRGRLDPAFAHVPVIAVPDTLPALQAAARAWRMQFPSLLRVGVTGSSGKTTLKEMIASVVARTRSVIRNPGNLNSDIGLAASIFLIRKTHEAAVFEMGINKPGEMDMLATMYEPDVAVINNIGSAHIGLLGGSRDAIAQQKKRIASQFNGTQTLLVPEDDDYAEFLVRDIAGSVQLFGPRSVALFEGARSLGILGWEIRYDGQLFTLSLPGAHNLKNALAAMKLAQVLDLPTSAVCDGLASVKALPGRSQVIEGSITVVNDCYNANEQSTLAAMEFCDQATVSGRRIYVLGSMKELGAEGPGAHARVGASAAHSGAALLMFYGLEAKDAYEAALAAGAKALCSYYERYEELEAALVKNVKPGDLVLLKASRSMALERVLKHIVPEAQSGGGCHAS